MRGVSRLGSRIWGYIKGYRGPLRGVGVTEGCRASLSTAI